MKKVFLVIASLFLISAACNGQWYHRKYGVNNIFQLTPEQFQESFTRARNGARTGAAISAVSTIGIVSGIILVSHDSPYAGDIGKNVLGILVLGVSIPAEITGCTVWGIYGSRTNKIKEILKNADIRPALLDTPSGLRDVKVFAAAGISVSFRF